MVNIAKFCRIGQQSQSMDFADPSRSREVQPTNRIHREQEGEFYPRGPPLNVVVAAPTSPVPGNIFPVPPVDPTYLVRNMVKCNGVLVSAIIDTGAAVTVVSSTLVKSLNLTD